MKDKSTELFANAPIPVAVLLNIIPTIISMIMVLVYNLADTFFIGQTKNALMVAAVSLATPIFLLFMAIGMLFGIGGTSLISRLLGEGSREKAKQACSFCFWTGSVIGILGMLFIWYALTPLSHLVGSSSDTVTYVKQYLFIVAIGVPFLIIGNIFSNILRAEGNASKAMLGVILGNLVNIILDPIMILGFGWNVAGAALATVIGNIFSAGFYILHFLMKKSILSIRIQDYNAGNRIALGVLAIGVPASLNSVLMSTSNIVINNLMVHHGDMAVAGLGVAMKVNMIAVMLVIGTGAGVQPLLGFCYGAKNKKRYQGVFKFSLCFAIALSAVMTILCYAGAGPMVKAFLDNPEAYQYGMQFARIYILSGPVLGILFLMINAIQSLGAAIPSLILSISRQGLIFMPVLYTFNDLFPSAKALVAAQPVTDYIATALSVLLFIMTFRRYFSD